VRRRPTKSICPGSEEVMTHATDSRVISRFLFSPPATGPQLPGAGNKFVLKNSYFILAFALISID
jgi:hypothetical protein